MSLLLKPKKEESNFSNCISWNIFLIVKLKWPKQCMIVQHTILRFQIPRVCLSAQKPILCQFMFFSSAWPTALGLRSNLLKPYRNPKKIMNESLSEIWKNCGIYWKTEKFLQTLISSCTRNRDLVIYDYLHIRRTSSHCMPCKIGTGFILFQKS